MWITSSPARVMVVAAVADAMTILCTDEPSFITSDSPVIWFDPTVAKDKFLTHKGLLSDPGIEVSMPLSPRQTIILHHPAAPFVKPVSYVRASATTAAALNRRTAHYVDKALVSWRDGFDPTWRILPPNRRDGPLDRASV